MKRLVKHQLCLIAIFIGAVASVLGQQQPQDAAKFETTYDSVKKQTTVRMPPVKISGDRDKYHSMHMSPSFKYAGETPVTPEIIDFELQTVVKGRLRTDLYVVFIIDGEKVFLSSNRSAVMRPVPGRVWMGERLVFRMPYATLRKLAGAKKVGIKMDAVMFDLSEEHLKLIRDFATLGLRISDR